MDILTRVEEYILLAIWKLGEDAYSLRIQGHILRKSGKKWSLGAIYSPLERLEKRKLISSYYTGATTERGGRHKRIYALTSEGKKALIATNKVHAQFWADIPKLALESSNDS